jgi:queuine tRNA-ribosyltransferase
VCRRFGRAYLRHLVIAGELLGMILGTIHNVTHYQCLMGSVRDAIEAGRFEELAARIAARPARAPDDR